MTFASYTAPQPDLESTRLQYVEFHNRLTAATSAADCLSLIADWDSVLCQFKEWVNITYIRFHQDTSNESCKAEMDTVDAISPKFADLETKLKQALLDSPFRKEIGVPQLFARWECNTRSFAPVIEEDLAAEAKLQSEYTALTASAEVDFQGEKLTISELNKFADDPDRSTRESACRTKSQWYFDESPALDRIYDEQVRLRHGMARKLGYDNFVGLGYQRMQRIGYGHAEVAAFRNEVREHVVPLAVELAEKQKSTLGIEHFRFWDKATRARSVTTTG